MGAPFRPCLAVAVGAWHGLVLGVNERARRRRRRQPRASIPIADLLIRSSAWFDGARVRQEAAQGGRRVLAFDEKPAAAEAAVAPYCQVDRRLRGPGLLAADVGQAALDRTGLAP